MSFLLPLGNNNNVSQAIENKQFIQERKEAQSFSDTISSYTLEDALTSRIRFVATTSTSASIAVTIELPSDYEDRGYFVGYGDSAENYVAATVGYQVKKEDGTTEDVTITTQNVRVVQVIYKDGIPYRWKECELYSADTNNAIYYFKNELITDNLLDQYNRIKITNMNEAGSTDTVYGYVDGNSKCSIYILAKLSATVDTAAPRKDLDDIAPGYDDYVVTNVYTTADGIMFYDNYTNVTNNRITAISSDEAITNYYIDSVPVVGRHYITDETAVKYFIEQITERKAYIDYCLELVENSMSIDFKYFNTYGPSCTYTLEDKSTLIGNIDITMNFKLSLKDTSDITTKDDIVASIKTIMENINDIGDWHVSNLITDIMNEYEDRINFIEFVGFNTYGADDQHIICVDDDNPTIVPEFINIRNYYDEETSTYTPAIEIEMV